ncbi:MAG: RHS domain-containing protein, partial [Polyangiaceae bacterium]|nr:RHS domain-containing protein [Polyangiaceae bacterium]
NLGHETFYDFDGNGGLLGVTFGVDPRWMDFSPESLAARGPVRAPWKATFARDALGNEVERRLPGGVVARWDRDSLGLPQVHRVRRANEHVRHVDYRWRSYEQLAELIDAEKGVTRFRHDARSYLVSASRPNGTIEYRAPDPVGNIYRDPERGDRRYGKGGRLEELGGVRYTHDEDGQLLEKKSPDGSRWRYAWDQDGQLQEVTRPDGQKVTFAYDALGRRVKKSFAGKTTTYVWDGDDLVHEVIENAALVTWVFEPGTFAPLAKVEGEARYGVVTDHLGTPEMVFDEMGEFAWKAQLDIYGVAHTDSTKTGCSWRWPGQYEDEETGLYHNRFRYYDSGSGRYISQDPIGIHGGIQPYSYVPDPTWWTDPLGLSKKCGLGRSFVGPTVSTNRHGQLTNGRYILDTVGMSPHTTGSLAGGKSQFLYRVNEKQLVLDAAAYADEVRLWVGNKAKIVLDDFIGVHARTGERTHALNIYRTDSGFIHGAPGSPR